jgi:hypothetical protein
LNIASALIKQVIALQDFETWSEVREHYLPPEYHKLFKKIDGHCEKYHILPTFEDLDLDIRDSTTRESLYAINALEVDVEPHMLLQYLKNEYTQKEILLSLDSYIEDSICFEDAEESVAHLHQIVLDIEDKVELEIPAESMQRIPLFESDEELSKYLSLGLNAEHDHEIQFAPIDLVLIGGKRGSGKSLTCANIANNVFDSGKSAIYYTIEMNSRSILQRSCAIATGISFSRLRTKNLNVTEWKKVASWWAGRFEGGEGAFNAFNDHGDFEKFHQELTTKYELLPAQQLDVVYDPSLTISKIRADLDRKIKGSMDVGVIIVDYINQLRRSSLPARGGLYDWTEQIEVSKSLKQMAQDYEVTFVSPYQIDASGEARFAKGILDAADAAYTLDAHEQEDACVTFKCVKQRSASLIDFTSSMDWETLKMGPETALSPKEREEEESRTGEEINDI